MYDPPYDVTLRKTKAANAVAPLMTIFHSEILTRKSNFIIHLRSSLIQVASPHITRFLSFMKSRVK